MPGTKNSGGRNKKSAGTHVLQGTFRRDRHADDATPAPPQGDPVPPVKLTGEAKAEWARMLERLRTSRTLALVDDAVLYQYVKLFAETEQIDADHGRLRTEVKTLMKLAQDLEGYERLQAIERVVALEHIIARQVQQLRQGHMAIRQYLVEFGMTPSARTRVKAISEPKPLSKIDQFRNAKQHA